MQLWQEATKQSMQLLKLDLTSPLREQPTGTQDSRLLGRFYLLLRLRSKAGLMALQHLGQEAPRPLTTGPPGGPLQVTTGGAPLLLNTGDLHLIIGCHTRIVIIDQLPQITEGEHQLTTEGGLLLTTEGDPLMTDSEAEHPKITEVGHQLTIEVGLLLIKEEGHLMTGSVGEHPKITEEQPQRTTEVVLLMTDSEVAPPMTGGPGAPHLELLLPLLTEARLMVDPPDLEEADMETVDTNSEL